MTDIAYLAGIVAFFGLMLAYVAACERLGESHRDTSHDAYRDAEWREKLS